MSEEKAKSAIDEIFAISERLETIEKYLVVIDSNIKNLNNKVSKLSKKIEGGVSTRPSAAAVAKTPSASAPGPSLVPARNKGLVIGDIKLFGYIFSKNNSPIKGVNITVYNETGEVIKEKVSNNDGHWSVRLPPGKYGVEYNHHFGNRKFKPINRTVELNERTKEYEVT